MRDDLHKGAPVRRHWSGLIKAITKLPFGSSEITQRVTRAVKLDINQDLRSSVTSDLKRMIHYESDQGTQGPALATKLRRYSGGNLLYPLEKLLVEHIERRASSQGSYSPDDLVRDSIGDAIGEGFRTVMMDMESHVARKSPRDLPEWRNRVQGLPGEIPFDDLSSAIFSGVPMKVDPIRAKQIEIQSEDLRNPR